MEQVRAILYTRKPPTDVKQMQTFSTLQFTPTHTGYRAFSVWFVIGTYSFPSGAPSTLLDKFLHQADRMDHRVQFAFLVGAEFDDVEMEMEHDKEPTPVLAEIQRDAFIQLTPIPSSLSVEETSR